ncbi:2-oxoglutarate and iron-dependent oxygenase domain-containing protein [Komagataeibacter swingsii]|uniref:2-oxoglutarate and iron-dependent oxygenase domain-containing protein n=1 Tax=Komagataeibacter swingsii TaxID=215220 RepID=UPI00210D3C4D|nr:2-oxoglutarate and iron-dependent oxygenase domain-containing protein [Komagataeibacter swingsii]
MGNAQPALDRAGMMGGQGACIARAIPRIDLSDYDRRKPAIADVLRDAVTRVGFFQVINHGIDAADVDAAFAAAGGQAGRRAGGQAAGGFFDLPMGQKAHHAYRPGSNVAWECRAQVRPSTGTPDNMESCQITPPH